MRPGLYAILHVRSSGLGLSLYGFQSRATDLIAATGPPQPLGFAPKVLPAVPVACNMCYLATGSPRGCCIPAGSRGYSFCWLCSHLTSCVLFLSAFLSLFSLSEPNSVRNGLRLRCYLDIATTMEKYVQLEAAIAELVTAAKSLYEHCSDAADGGTDPARPFVPPDAPVAAHCARQSMMANLNRLQMLIAEPGDLLSQLAVQVLSYSTKLSLLLR